MKEEKDGLEGLHYQNGQSEVEKLMREHLQNGKEITDEDLRNLKVGVPQDSATREEDTTDKESDRDGGFGERQEGDAPGNTWDVLSDE